jgi:glycyl-tRNA synthetase
MPADRLDALVSLSKRRGFVYPSSEIYGGLRASWDYGPLGVELKNNVKRQWWKSTVMGRDDVVGLDSCVILAREVWQASGHVETFSDPLTECQSCHKRFRADHLTEAYENKHGRPPANGLADINCPNCGTKGAFTEPRQFSGLLKTYLGPVEDESGLAYLRPETAQGIFINYKNVEQTSRKKPPFGIAQIGKSFRNEITPGNFIFRTREFEQMEMEFFVQPGTDEEWHQIWIDTRLQWFTDLGIAKDRLRLFEHPKDKLSHYSKRTVDIEYKFDFAGTEWGELEGIANRTDFDLIAHSKASGVDLSFFDQEAGERWVPYVIEPAVGVDRSVLTFLPTPRASWRSGPSSSSTTGSPRSRPPYCRCPATPTSHPRHAASRRPCGRTGTSTSTTPARSAAGTGARTRSAPRTASPSISAPSMTTR